MLASGSFPNRLLRTMNKEQSFNFLRANKKVYSRRICFPIKVNAAGNG
jgi:hypothetical protein